MKLKYKPIEKNTLDFVHARRIKQPYLGSNWHFHEDFELIYFLEGQGIRIVGDHISNFKKGELVLVGGWLPHLWRNDINGDGCEADFIVVKFRKTFENFDLFALPDLTEINALLKKSKRGLFFSKQVLPQVHELLIQLSESQSTEKFITFLRLFQILSKEENTKTLSTPNFVLPAQASNENRLQKVINYIFANHQKTISLEEISEVAIMTPPAFCRFFKNRTNKTFSHFLNEFRIGKACQLLINGEYPIKQICYETGFNSLTSFNRTFKAFKETTPSAYRNNFRRLLEE